MAKVTWRGHTFDARTVKMLVEAERLTGFTLRIMQGSYSDGGQSAGTHEGGGAFDCDDYGMTQAQRDKLIVALRRVGFAAWWRPTIAGKWGSHFHGIAIGCPDLAPSAQKQVVEYYAGGDGLTGSNPDPHRALNAPKQTWEQYVASRRPPFPLPTGHSFGTPKSASVHDGTEGPVTADNVRKIQHRLGISRTGRYGLYTKSRVAAWQAWRRLPVSGRVGATTWKALGL
jgi:peptidoglycan hydrolase-like protein with peptidoglycan-binding domain